MAFFTAAFVICRVHMSSVSGPCRVSKSGLRTNKRVSPNRRGEDGNNPGGQAVETIKSRSNSELCPRVSRRSGRSSGKL